MARSFTCDWCGNAQAVERHGDDGGAGSIPGGWFWVRIAQQTPNQAHHGPRDAAHACSAACAVKVARRVVEGTIAGPAPSPGGGRGGGRRGFPSDWGVSEDEPERAS